MPTELTVLALACVWMVVQILSVAVPRALTFGPMWAAGARDTTPGALDNRIERAQRALRNYQETFPIFVALALAVVVADVSSAQTALGAQIYLAARVIYALIYVFHVAFVRSLVWVGSMIGLLLMGWPLLFAAPVPIAG